MGRAVRGRWPMNQEMRALVVQTLGRILGSADAPFASRVSACRTLIAADRVNVELELSEGKGPTETETAGRKRLDFSCMSDAELERYIEQGGNATP